MESLVRWLMTPLSVLAAAAAVIAVLGVLSPGRQDAAIRMLRGLAVLFGLARPRLVLRWPRNFSRLDKLPRHERRED